MRWSAVLARFGFVNVTLAALLRRGDRLDQAIWANTQDPRVAEWNQTYRDEGYGEVDPLMRFLRRAVKPFEYDEAPYDPNREPRAAEVVRRRREFEFRDGLVVPILGPAGTTVFVAMSGPRPDMTDRTKPALHLIALYAFYRFCCLRSTAAVEKPRLTDREREVLTWIASGKSAWEVGEILRISRRTVEEHAQHVLGKLGAANRTHAVATAIRDHLIAV
jgi:LuxR family quorum sensing-dependent transcriptional regulator